MGVVVALALGAITTNSWDVSVTPVPSSVSSSSRAIVAANDALRVVGPLLLAVGVAMLAIPMLRARESDRALLRVAMTDYSVSGRRTRRLLAGLGLTLAALCFISISSAVEDEVATGPNRGIDRLATTLGIPDDDGALIVVQAADVVPMDNSYLPRAAVRRTVAAVTEVGGTALPFNLALTSVEYGGKAQTSLVFGVPNEESGSSADACDTAPVQVDEVMPIPTGADIIVAGRQMRMAGPLDGASSLNRVVGLMSLDDFSRCVIGDTRAPYYGVAMSGISKADAEAAVDGSGLSAAVLTLDEYRDANEQFWSNNSTPIILQMIAYLAVFGGIALALQRRDGLRRSQREIAALWAIGWTTATLRRLEIQRAAIQTLFAALIACMVVPVLAFALNSGQVGLQASVGPVEICVGAGLVFATRTVAAALAVRSITRKDEFIDSLR